MRKIYAGLIALGFLGAGCVNVVPYDYTTFNQHPPRSILVLPPLNSTPEVRATYGYLSTVTAPLAEKGYYVYDVSVVDEMMKENGLPGPTEMQAVPLEKIKDVFNADAVLYIDVRKYGTSYVVLNSVTEVQAQAKLVDVKTGKLLWDGDAAMQQGANNGGASGNPLAALVAAAVSALVNQIIADSTDHAHVLSSTVNVMMLNKKERELPDGPYKVKK